MSQNEEIDTNVSKSVIIRLKFSAGLSISKMDFSLPLSIEDTLADLKQSLTILPITRSITNYKLMLDNFSLDNYDSFTIEEIMRDLGCDFSSDITLNLMMCERPYTLSSVFGNLVSFREISGFHFNDRSSNDFGTSGGVSKYNLCHLPSIRESDSVEKFNANGDQSVSQHRKESPSPEEENKPSLPQLSSEQLEKLKSISQELLDTLTPSLVQHGSYSSNEDLVKLPVRQISVSKWSPVPTRYVNKGDLLYLSLQTLENESFHITCHLTGFYVNRSTNIKFAREPRLDKDGNMIKYFTLYQLVDALSPLFSKVINENAERLSEVSEYAETYLLPTSFQVNYPWLVKDSSDVNPDISRSQLPLIVNGVDGDGYIKEWNEDIQTIRELPKASIEERILREKLFNKSLSEFNKVATETAINIIKGNFEPMNPNDPPNNHIFLRNGIFYSFPSTGSGSLDSTGGTESWRYKSAKDLASIRILNRIDPDHSSRLVTCIVDFVGKRVVCQAPVPGIFSNLGQTEEKVSYGMATDGLHVNADEAFKEAMQEISNVFYLAPHNVKVANGQEQLFVSKDVKGIKGTDGRKYVMDLYRTTPLDINFIEENWDAESKSSYPHREVLLRHEAVEEWWRRTATDLFKQESDRLEKEGKLFNSEEDFKRRIVLPDGRISFNPDVFTGVESSLEDKEKVRSISSFVKDKLLEEFLSEFPSNLAPFDGSHLCYSLHKAGINLRYLGYIAEEALRRRMQQEEMLKNEIKVNEIKISEENNTTDSQDAAENSSISTSNKDETMSSGKFEPLVSNYDALYKLSVQEIVARVVKHLLRKLSDKIPFYLLSKFTSHFLNCVFMKDIDEEPRVVIEDELRNIYDDSVFNFSSLTKDSVDSLIVEEAYKRFRFILPKNWFIELISPLQLFREITLKFGIQWKAKDYHLTRTDFEREKIKYLALQSKKKTNGSKLANNTEKFQINIFSPEDIVSFIPITKDSSYRASVLDDIFETSKACIVQGKEEVGLIYLNDLSVIYEQIYGRVHSETSNYYITVAQIFADLGKNTQSCDFARRAIILSERVHGFDSYQAISTYLNSAYYEFLNGDLISSFILYEKAIKAWEIVFGKGHPSFVTTLTNLSGMLSEASLYSDSLKFLHKALEISKHINGSESQLTALIQYRIGTSYASMNNFKSALHSLKVANQSFTRVLGPNDYFSKESSKYVANLTTYIDYLKHEEETKKKKLNERGAPKFPNMTKQNIFSKKSSKNAPVQSDPHIASKSVDEILDFIENKAPKSKRK